MENLKNKIEKTRTKVADFYNENQAIIKQAATATAILGVGFATIAKIRENRPEEKQEPVELTLDAGPENTLFMKIETPEEMGKFVCIPLPSND